MSHPKFQSKASRRIAATAEEMSAWVAAMPPEESRAYHADALNAIRHRAHHAYVRRNGGNWQAHLPSVTVLLGCKCHLELDVVKYDRHGELRPEERLRILGLIYYHRCPDA